MIQSIIFIFGVLYMWLLSCEKEKYMALGFLVLILVQPFWFYTTLSNQQYGMFTLAVIYFFIGLRGIYTHWLKHHLFNRNTVEIKGRPPIR